MFGTTYKNKVSEGYTTAHNQVMADSFGYSFWVHLFPKA